MIFIGRSLDRFKRDPYEFKRDELCEFKRDPYDFTRDELI